MTLKWKGKRMFKYLVRKSNFLQAVRVIFVFDIFVRVLQFVRELIFSIYYGFSRITDAFNYTVNILGTPINLIADALLVGIIPALNKKSSTQEKMNYVFSLLITFFCIISVLFLLFFVSFDYIMQFLAPGFDQSTLNLTLQFMLVYAGIGLLTVFNRILDNFFKAEKIFGLFNFSNLISAVLSILLLISLFKITPLAITIGMLIGAFVGFIILFIKLPVKKMTYFDKDAIFLVKKSIPLLISGGLGVINTFVDKSFSTIFEPGILTILSYATLIVMLVSSIITNAVGGASYAFIAAEVANNELLSVQTRIKQINFFFLTIFSFICLGFIILGKFFLELIFLRGAITSEDIDILFALTSIFLPSAIYTSIGAIVLQVFYSLDNLKVTTIVNSICIILQIMINVLFIKYFGYYTLAASSLISSLLSTTVNGYLLRRFYKLSAFNNKIFIFSMLITLITPLAIIVNQTIYLVLGTIIVYFLFFSKDIKNYSSAVKSLIAEKNKDRN